MPTRRLGWELVQVDVEKPVHPDFARATLIVT